MDTETRTLRTDAGVEVTTPLTDAEAYELVREAAAAGRVSAFGARLTADYAAYGGRLTPNKLVWLHKYALAVLDREQRGDDTPVDFGKGGTLRRGRRWRR